MDKLSYLFFPIAVIGLFIGGFALASVQSVHDKINDIEITETFDWRTDKDFWKFINDNYISEGELNQTNDDIEANFITFQNEIVKIKKDIKSKFPQASEVEQQEQTSISTTPFLTLKMDQTEFLVGEVIVFHGIASPTHPVIITVKLPDRTLESVAVSKTAIINGEYTAEFQTQFDSPKGTWQVYARQLSDQTKTLTFKVE